ncbi:MAG: PaaI family thioesterase [Bacillota bacterium]|nr:PaaI family thioesterase [Bacillota bacterium]
MEKSITVGFPVQECQLNEHDTMHAGFIAAAFDEALGIFASLLSGGKSSVSINISLNYIKPIPKDDTIMITAKATSLGRTLITVSGECILKSNGLLTNTALATFAVVG